MRPLSAVLLTTLALGCADRESVIEPKHPASSVAATTADALDLILSGGPAPSDPLGADDDMSVLLNGTAILVNNDNAATLIAPLSFTAHNGDALRVIATDVWVPCKSLSPLYLHDTATGTSQVLDSDGFPHSCEGGTGSFYDVTFVIDLPTDPDPPPLLDPAPARVSAGEEHTCVLRDDGTVGCWGRSTEAQTGPPPTSFLAITGGGFHHCGLAAGGRAECWGDDRLDQSSVPSGLTFAQVEAGASHSCGITTTARLVCWGLVPLSTPTGTFRQVSAGGQLSCALNASGEPVCWGLYGADGISTPGGVQLTQVTTGWNHGCGILAGSGTLLCWGLDEHDQVSGTPAGEYSQVSSYYRHSCAISTEGTIECWGLNDQGQTDAPEGEFLSVTTGLRHSCALRIDGRVLCWGSNGRGQSAVPAEFATLGPSAAAGGPYRGTVGVPLQMDGSASQPAESSPILSYEWSFGDGSIGSGIAAVHVYASGGSYPVTLTVTDANGFRSTSTTVAVIRDPLPQLALGASYTCLLQDVGTVRCWGNSPYNAHKVPATEVFTEITAGFASTCGLRPTGEIACYGSDGSGQNSPPPGEFIQVSMGRYHGCAVTAQWTIACWGSNAFLAMEVPPGSYAQVSAGWLNTCALTTELAIECVGLIYPNNGGTAVPPSGRFVQVSAGEHHACALAEDLSVVCWGVNTAGEVGGTPGPGIQTFTHPGPFRSVSAAQGHTCALRDNGTVSCWGYNQDLRAAAPPGTFAEVVAGPDHSCARQTAGRVICWGVSGGGQTTVPAEFANRAPVAHAGGPYPGNAGEPVHFDASGSLDPDGDPLTFEWNLHGVGTVTGPLVSRTFPERGIHFLTLTVSDPYGASAQAGTWAAISDGADAMTATCAKSPTGVAWDGTYYFVAEGHGSLFQCITRFDASGRYVDHKVFDVDHRGLHFVSATGKLFSKTWSGSLHEIDYQAGTQRLIAGSYGFLDHQAQPAADPDGSTYWVLFEGHAQRRNVVDNEIIEEFAVESDANPSRIAVSHDYVLVPNETGVNAYSRLTRSLVASFELDAISTYPYGFGVSLSADRVMFVASDGRVQSMPIQLNTAPLAAISATPNPVLFSQSVAFDGSSSSDPDPGDALVLYEWDFDGNGTWDASGAVVSHTYGVPGEYGALLRVTDSHGRTGTASIDIQVLAHGETLEGSDITVDPVDKLTGEPLPATLTFAEVSAGGTTTASVEEIGQSGGPPQPQQFRLGQPPTYLNIETTASFTGAINVCLDYSQVSYGNESRLRLLHFDDEAWIDITTSVDAENKIICGVTSSLSPFLTAESNAEPVVTRTILPVSPSPAGTSISTAADFTDENPRDTHSGRIDWGDGTVTAASVTEIDGAGQVVAQHAYDVPGVYAINVSVSDGELEGTRSSATDIPAYVVVYDPTAGFITGGGWITSPSGACRWSGCALDGSSTGKASFGFVAKYRKGATIPEGNTEFLFSTGGLQFSSTIYQWLVVAGPRAQFKGSGRINGNGDFGFLLTATDGDAGGGTGTDRFRIKIWESATGFIVYDNELGTDDGSDPSTALGGGSIVLHTPKK